MIDVDIARVRAAAAELEAAINAIGHAHVSIDLSGVELMRLGDERPRNLWSLSVWVGGAPVRVYP